MKKNIFPIALCVIAGLFMGTYMFSQYDDNEIKKVSGSEIIKNQNIYAFQYGVYSNKENMKNNLNNINYTYEYINDKYYAYVGFVSSEKNTEKLKKYFKSISYNTYMKQIEVSGEFFEILKQYDLLLDEALTNESIETILKSTIAKFEELAINDKNQRITN